MIDPMRDAPDEEQGARAGPRATYIGGCSSTRKIGCSLTARATVAQEPRTEATEAVLAVLRLDRSNTA